jgi:hypothetical protein
MRTIFRKRWLLAFNLVALVLANAALAAEEPIAVIVSSEHARNLKKDDLSLLYKRKKLFWGDGVKAQPVNLPASHPLRRVFSQAVLGHTPEELEKYWNDLYFHGISPPYVLASEEAVLRFVADTPGAIGYVPFCSANTHVTVALIVTAGGRISEDIPTVDCGH